MDKLRHIDELLKESLGQSIEAGEYSSDWLAIEKRLKQRKNRIYAMWFSLALIALTSVSIVLYTNLNTTHTELAKDHQSENVTDDLKGQETVKETIDQDTDQSDIAKESGDNEGSNIELTPGSSDNRTSATNNTDPETGVDNNTSDVADTNGETGDSNEDPRNTPEIESVPRIATVNNLVLVEEEIPSLINTPELIAGIDKVKTPPIKEDKDSKFALSHMEMGVSFTPSISGKRSSEREELSWLIINDYNSKVSSSESASFASSTSFNLEFHFENGWFLGTGLGLTQRTEALNYNYEIDSFWVSTDYDNKKVYRDVLAPPDRLQVDYSGSNSYHFIEIPLTIGYKHSLGRNLELRHQADLSYMLLYNELGKKADYTTLELNDLADLNYFNNSNVSATLKSGLYYNFKNFVIGAEPTVGMNLNSLSNSNSAIKITPYAYGFNLTTNIKINQR